MLRRHPENPMNHAKLVVFVLSAFFVTLHRPNGEEVFVNAEQVDYIGPADTACLKPIPRRGDCVRLHDPRAKSEVMVYGIWVTVAETPRDIRQKINQVLKQDDY